MYFFPVVGSAFDALRCAGWEERMVQGERRDVVGIGGEKDVKDELAVEV